jgi:hypothetical protein
MIRKIQNDWIFRWFLRLDRKRGIELVEIQVQNKHNNQKHLKRFLAKSEENIKKAKDYLNYLAIWNGKRKSKK